MSHPIAEDIRAEIERRLCKVETDEGVRFVIAVESGSRAWGFPSPDSDYDVRFVYVRPRDWYLALVPGRDVIEQPIVDDIDLNGWDVKKFLNLMLRSNAVTTEWLSSPIRYRSEHPVAAVLREIAPKVFDPQKVAQHYAHLGRNAAERWFDTDGEIPVKRYFYALRPALAIRAMRHDPLRLPPMNLQELVASSCLPRALLAMIEELVEAKRETRELANARRYRELDAMIEDELGRAHEIAPRKPDPASFNVLNQVFLDLVNT